MKRILSITIKVWGMSNEGLEETVVRKQKCLCSRCVEELVDLKNCNLEDLIRFVKGKCIEG